MATKKETFYNLKYDAVFKKVVGDKENTKFINKILSNILESKVEVIEFIGNELPKEKRNKRNNTLDMLVKSKDNKIIDIEVNSNYDQITRERNLVYYSNIYGMYTKKEYKIDDKILIDLVYNGGIKTPKKEIYYLTSKESGNIYSKRFRIIKVNIKRYKEEWKRKESKEEDKYIVALDANKDELEELSKEDEIIKEVKEKVFIFNEDGTITRMISIEEEKELMQKARERIALEKGINKGINKGRKEGKKEGLITGRKEGEQKILCELLKIYDIEKVHEMTKVPIKEIKGCIKKYNKKNNF